MKRPSIISWGERDYEIFILGASLTRQPLVGVGKVCLLYEESATYINKQAYKGEKKE